MDAFVFGTHAVESVLQHQPQRVIRLLIQEGNKRDDLVAKAKASRIPVESVSKQKLKERFGVDSVHQGLCLLTKEFPYIDFDQALAKSPKLCVVLDSLEDPRNLGRAARSAFAFGAELLVIPKDRSTEVTAAAEKAAVGALARIPVARVTNLNRALEDLRQAGLWVIGSSDQALMPAWQCDFTKPVALVIGNEEKGLRQQVAKNCDEMVQIPMQEAGMSLNAADALTVLMYEVCRQRS